MNILYITKNGKCGRKHKTTTLDDRSMVRMIRNEPLLSAKQGRAAELLRRGVNVLLSIRIVQRWLSELGYMLANLFRRPKLSQGIQSKKSPVCAPVQFWRTVCFSDVSDFKETSEAESWQSTACSRNGESDIVYTV